MSFKNFDLDYDSNVVIKFDNEGNGTIEQKEEAPENEDEEARLFKLIDREQVEKYSVDLTTNYICKVYDVDGNLCFYQNSVNILYNYLYSIFGKVKFENIEGEFLGIIKSNKRNKEYLLLCKKCTFITKYDDEYFIELIKIDCEEA